MGGPYTQPIIASSGHTAGVTTNTGGLRIVSWNVNSIRIRQPRVLAWIDRHKPDVMLLQETKCTDAVFAGAGFSGAITACGYEVAHHGVDHWNGVAILSRVGLTDVRSGFATTARAPFDEARVISGVCGGLRMWSVYAPNGRGLDDPHYRFKLAWFARLRADLAIELTASRSRAATVVAGDFNVAPTDLDIYDPVRWRRRTHASPAEREAVAALLDLGLIDVTREHLSEAGVYTWWNYRPGQFERNRGLRIDLALCSADVAARRRRVWIDTDERGGDVVSDHAPLVVDLDA
jgi:exodeoxyribonuclease-3